VVKQREAAVAVTKRLNKNSALSALTLSAMAIPGMSNAAVVPENKTLSVRYTQYQEEDMPQERVVGLNTQRYSIDVLQVRYFTPVDEKYSLDTSVQYETLSGASPYDNTLNSNGQTVVNLSGATIEETRVDASVAGTRYFKEGTLTSSVYASKENDYQSLGLGLSGSLEINQKHTTLLGSISTSFDELSPTPLGSTLAGSRLEADGQSKRSFSVYEGVTQVLNKFSTLQVGIGYTRLSGYLSDPYRSADRRPDTREQTTVTAQYRHYLTQMGGVAWHLDYRFYQDDWGVLANTFTSSVWKDIDVFGLHITLAPNVRYHWQHAADFYTLAPTGDRSGDYYSDDFRLSAYGAISVGIDMQYHHNNTVFNLGFSQYNSAENWGLSGSQDSETPALVNFTTLSLGVEYHF